MSISDIGLLPLLLHSRDRTLLPAPYEVALDTGGCAGEVEKKSYTVLAPGGTYGHIYNE